jgi:hypothetical protein
MLAHLGRWIDGVKQRLGEAATSNKKHINSLINSLTDLQETVTTASTTQLGHIEEHTHSMQTYLTQEKTVLHSQTDKLAHDLTAYIQQMLKDHANTIEHRTETALTEFVRASNGIAAENRAQLTQHKAAVFDLVHTSNEWQKESDRHIDASLDQARAHHASSLGHLQHVRANAKNCDVTTSENVGANALLTKNFVEQDTLACNELDTTVHQATQHFASLTTRGTQELTNHASDTTSRSFVSRRNSLISLASFKLLSTPHSTPYRPMFCLIPRSSRKLKRTQLFMSPKK